MDDRELEARLRTHLRHRFDAAAVPAGLAAAVREGMLTTPMSKVGFAMRPGNARRRLGWLATAGAIVVAVAVGALLILRPGLRPAGPAATPGPSHSPIPTLQVIAERWFLVLPGGGGSPSASDRDAAVQVLLDRLASLGLKGTSSEPPATILLTLEREGLPDEDIIRIIRAAGEVEFVPLPPQDYAGVDTSTLVGSRLPAGLTSLFGREGIASATRSTSATQNLPTIDITLTPAASALFADYTTNHTGEYLALVIDGEVALVPVMNEPITGGQVSISGGGNPGPNPFRPDTSFDIAAAIIVGGRLPEVWLRADVAKVLTQQQAIDAVRASGHAGIGDLTGANLDVLEASSRWRAVWRVSFAGGATVTIDAVTGAWLSTGSS